MSEYIIEHILPSHSHSVNEDACLLWVWHADKVPPHIGFSTQGRYFSLKANGKDEALSLNHVLQIVERKQITTLAFELSDSVEMTAVQTAFDNYSTTIPREVTCLQPIKDVLMIASANQLVDLLNALYTEQRVARVVGFNADSFSGIKEYNPADIHDRLEQLANDK